MNKSTGVDRYYLFVVMAVVFFGLLSLGGYILLLTVGQQRPAPELLNFTFSCAGALFGAVLKPTQNTNQGNTDDIIGQLGAKAALQLMKDSIQADIERKK